MSGNSKISLLSSTGWINILLCKSLCASFSVLIGGEGNVFFFYLMICFYLCVSFFVYMPCVCARRGHKRVTRVISLMAELSHIAWMLGTKLSLSGRAASGLNH